VENIKTRGYRFMEAPTSDGKFVHYERQIDGAIVSTKLDRHTAEYEVVYESKAPVPELGVRSMDRWFVRNRLTGEVVGERLAFDPMHGWADRITLNRWFGTGLRGCRGDVPSGWREELLLPKKLQ
jgi:hypothetical protein